MKNKLDKNFRLALRIGDFQSEQRYLMGIPNALSPAQRKRYVPYLNIYDERGVIGTLTQQDLRRLHKWMVRVWLVADAGQEG